MTTAQLQRLWDTCDQSPEPPSVLTYFAPFPSWNKYYFLSHGKRSTEFQEELEVSVARHFTEKKQLSGKLCGHVFLEIGHDTSFDASGD